MESIVLQDPGLGLLVILELWVHKDDSFEMVGTYTSGNDSGNALEVEKGN
jgi:hypothetical protein